jgi:hypothetical protein
MQGRIEEAEYEETQLEPFKREKLKSRVRQIQMPLGDAQIEMPDFK